ncbi:acyltransferase [Enterococcus canis]|uniref:Acyltransferase n=2 Tax=Enterococcus canis TaxID=214095 RepID=A0A1L8RE94_9ENTE|nr:acyltransferase [Enterococcus canis]
MIMKRLMKSRYITGFDGIRTLAVIGVIFYHLLPTKMAGGYLGVPIFFVVSGYLITDLLQQEWQQNGTIKVGQFYLRRMRRLYPAMVVMLIAAAAYITVFQQNLLNNLRGVVLSSLLYYNNWWQINQGLSYFDNFSGGSPFTHIWSLAVEGQFYLFWPVAYLLMKKFLKQKWILRLLGGLTLVSILLMAFLYAPGADPTRVYYGTDTRLFSILMGGLLAFVWPSTHLRENIPRQAKMVLNIAGAVALLGLMGSLFFLADHYAFVYYGGMVLTSLLAVILVAVVAHPGASWNKWLTNPIFTWIGKRSYGIYLYQFPIMIFFEDKLKNLSDHVFLYTLIELVLILGISELSYRLIERPFLRREITWQSTWQSLRQPLQKGARWVIPTLLVTLIAIVGLATAPSNQVSAQQQALQEQIAKNKQQAAERREKAKADAKKQTTETTETSEKTESTEKPDAATTKLAQYYGLTDAQLQEVQKIPITAFGDSVMLGAGAELQELFPKLVLDAEEGRQLYASVDEVKKMADEGLLTDTILVGLGTNGPFTETQFAEFMKALGNRKVYWMTMRDPNSRWQNQVNASLQQMADKYDNLTLIDWYQAANDHPEWFYDDSVHVNGEGRAAYASLVAQSLLK